MGQPGGDQRRPGKGRGSPIVLAPCLLISAWLDYTRLKTSYDIANKGPGKGEEASYPCFHMSEICIARAENILWHCQQACDQQGWERKPYCDSCQGTQASLPPPLTVTLTLLTPNKIYWKKYFSLIKPLRFNSSLLDDIWESQWKRTYTICPIGISFATLSIRFFQVLSKHSASKPELTLPLMNGLLLSAVQWPREGVPKKSCCSFGFCPNEGGGGPCPNFLSPICVGHDEEKSHSMIPFWTNYTRKKKKRKGVPYSEK